MKRVDIRGKLVRVAERFRSDSQNIQALRHFEASLLQCEDKEVFHGLVGAFEESGYEQDGYLRQEVAGRMLLVCRPEPDAELVDVLGTSASNYNLSVEQFPFYLALCFGRDYFRERVQERIELPSTSAQEKKALETYLYWTRLSKEQILEEAARNRLTS